jgi:very-short-patch-repair endonuclease
MDKEQIFRFSRELRKKQTEAEKVLWNRIRNRNLDGYKFLRQHPIAYLGYNNQKRYFIPDFYCAEKRIVIELDGKIHEFQKEYDKNREAVLNDLDINVIRFKNEELEDIDKVLDIIKTQLKK